MASRRLALLLVLSAPAFAATNALVGPGVGNADSLISDGTKLYNQKKFAKAAEQFLAANRANPAALPTYLQLARSLLAAKQVQRACYVYRVYLKAAPESPDRRKGQAESDQCERQLKTAKGQPPDLSQKYVETRANFFASLDKGELVGAGSASEDLATLVKDGYLGPELGDMAAKLGSAAVAKADEIHKAALANEKMSLERLRAARPLYQAAADVGASPADQKARTAFLDGLAFLQERDFKRAHGLFTEAARADSSNKEYVFYQGLALIQGGDRVAALKILETELKDDPRTRVLRAALALGNSSDDGAAELERLLFSTRYPPEK
jgi:thioredoxin-like negative regulator of GroEL